MKFLEHPRLAMLSSFLGNRELGDRIINGRIEAFSCKRAGEDKKLARSLEQQYVEEMASSAGSTTGTSPLGPLTDSATRRLLIDLISTMNASFPDHDFSALTVDAFVREPSAPLVVSRVNRHLADVGESYQTPFLDELWGAIEDVINVRDCEVYAYTPDMDEDPFSDGALWSFNYFFFNKALKRILYFTCVARSRATVDDERWHYTPADGAAMDDEGEGPAEATGEGDDDDMDAEYGATGPLDM